MEVQFRRLSGSDLLALLNYILRGVLGSMTKMHFDELFWHLLLSNF